MSTVADQVHIDHAELHAHAAKLDELAGELGTTGSTAAGIDLGDGAFGTLLGWLPGVITTVTPSQSGAITAAQGAVTRTAGAVRVLAQDFTDTDQQIADQMNKIRG